MDMASQDLRSDASVELDLAIQKNGANARAMGQGKFDNPLMKDAAMPRATGETLEQWVAKLDAWDLGWAVEDAMRSKQEELAALSRLIR